MRKTNQSWALTGSSAARFDTLFGTLFAALLTA